MAELHCRHLRLPGEPGFWCFRLDEQGAVRDLRPEASHGAEGRHHHHWDWQGDWLSPAAVDLQINGLQGLWFAHLEPEHLDRLHQALVWLRRQGVDAVCPTLTTAPPARLRQSLALLRRVREQQGGAEARLLGAHLEGPFLAVSKRGAHPRRHVQPLKLEHLKQLMDGFSAEDVALLTMAPELDPRHEALDWLVEQGIVVSLGYTEASQTQVAAAFAAGACLLTHTFNAMPSLHHRAPGPVASACMAPEPVFLGLIADGNGERGGRQRGPERRPQPNHQPLGHLKGASYNGIAIPAMITTVVDGPGVIIIESDGITSVTKGGSDSYTVVLASDPTANVKIRASSDTPGVALVNGREDAYSTFTLRNWNRAQTVTVSAVDDNVDQDGNRREVIIHAEHAEVDGLESSEGSLSRLRLGLEAVRPLFPLSPCRMALPSSPPWRWACSGGLQSMASAVN